jgi:hypothetical protein
VVEGQGEFVPTMPEPMVVPTVPEPMVEAAGLGVEWRRIELLPGLELHLRHDASPFAQGLAAAIASGRFVK